MADKYIEETLLYCDQILNDKHHNPTVHEINLIQSLTAIIQVYQHQSNEIKEIYNIMHGLLQISAGPETKIIHKKQTPGPSESGKFLKDYM